ncbi:MAG: trypsin-like peptidase domain-containing protein, partial [Deltaproteobacteria bacterium]|nr:trypsin-like peptidase domain-containing protein [Deltaproteobacteria bacterium]
MKKLALVFLVFVMGAAASFAYLYQKDNFSPLIAKSPVWTENSPSIPPSQDVSDIQIFVKISEKLNPTVVNIHTSQTVKTVSPFEGFENDEFFRRFFDDFFGRQMPRHPKNFKQQSLGSGFIISKEGYIITNNHVIEKADEIKVKLTETDKKSYDAKVIGSDKRTDIALLKIDPKGIDLPIAPLGDSEKIRVGEWVAAIGHPFGYGHTVSHGIVSAKERLFGEGTTHPYNDFIQTDASINLGNSGGPLINIQGEVIGVNVATDARAQGIIGFAIPINVAKNIIPQLMEKGHAVRGFIGIQWYELTEDLVKYLKLTKGQEGVVVAEVVKGEPADLAGLKVYDVITEFNGKPIKSGRDLLQEVGKAQVGKSVSLKVLREGKEKTFTVTPIERKDEDE